MMHQQKGSRPRADLQGIGRRRRTLFDFEQLIPDHKTESSFISRVFGFAKSIRPEPSTGSVQGFKITR
jgi:hypothetical protein